MALDWDDDSDSSDWLALSDYLYWSHLEFLLDIETLREDILWGED